MKKNKHAQGKDFDIFTLWKTLLSIPVCTRVAHQDSSDVWVPQCIAGPGREPVPGSPDVTHSFVQQLNKTKRPEVVTSISELKPIARLCSFPSKKICLNVSVGLRQTFLLPCCLWLNRINLLIHLTFRWVASSSRRSCGLAVRCQHRLIPFRANGSLGGILQRSAFVLPAEGR